MVGILARLTVYCRERLQIRFSLGLAGMLRKRIGERNQWGWIFPRGLVSVQK